MSVARLRRSVAARAPFWRRALANAIILTLQESKKNEILNENFKIYFLILPFFVCI